MSDNIGLKEELSILLVSIEKAEEIRSDRIREAIAAADRGERALTSAMKDDVDSINKTLIDLRNQLKDLSDILGKKLNAIRYVPLSERSPAWEKRLNSPCRANGIIRKDKKWFQRTKLGLVNIKSPAHIIAQSPFV